MKVIDLEHHYYCPEYVEFLSKRTEYPYFDTETGMLHYHKGAYMPFGMPIATLNNITPIDVLQDTGELRLKMMDEAGVTVAALSSGASIEELDRENAVKFARMTNDSVAEICKKHPDRFVGTICLPTMYVEESIEELKRAKNELGLKYWHTHSSYKGENISEEKYLPLIQACAELDCPIYVHPHNPRCDYLLDYGMLFSSAGFGFGVDTMRTVLKFILNGRFDQFPNLKLIIGHIGEFFPYILSRLDNRFFAVPDPDVKCKENFRYYINNHNIHMTTSGITDKRVFVFALSELCQGCLMFGSDFPFEDFKGPVDFIHSVPASTELRERVFHKNAEEFIL